MDTKKEEKELSNKIQKIDKDEELASQRPITSTLSTEERLRVLANIIIDRILENQQKTTLELSK